jgi:hypothetical protein
MVTVVTSRRPVAFLSSTIYDLRDLRGAVRFWLEESGVEVWMSEFNDMVKPAGANAFEACFESIRQADFYILLIGDKKGSAYAADGTSVTQQEYREAYAAFLAQGRPIPIMFVRAEVRDRVDAWVRAARGGHPPFADATFIASFIEEIEQRQATAGALAGLEPYPLGNWLGRFNDFREISDGLRVALNLRVDVPLQRVLAAIRLDLEPTIAKFVGKDYYRPKGTPIEARLREVVDAMAEPDRKRSTPGWIGRALEEMVIKVPMPPHRLFHTVVRDCPLPKRPRDQPPVMLNAEQAGLLRRHLLFWCSLA